MTKLSINILQRNLFLYIITILIVLPSLLYSVKWYSPDESKTQYLKIDITGKFLKRGAIDLIAVSLDKKIKNIEKVIFTPCNGLQTIRIIAPVEFNNESFAIQFPYFPSDSFSVKSIRYISEYSDDNFHVKKDLNKDKNGSIIIAPKTFDRKTISNLSKGKFIIISPLYSLKHKDYKSGNYSVVFIIFYLILFLSVIYYKRLCIISYFFIFISCLSLIALSYTLSSINFRSLIHKKSYSSPTLELGMVVPIDERISLFWASENSSSMNVKDDQKVKYDVNGSPDVQNFVFPLPDEIKIEKLRLYLGKLPFGNREIHYLRFRKYDMVIDIPVSTLPSFFTTLHHVYHFRPGEGKINIPIKDQNPYLETQNNLTDLLYPLYEYRINRMAGFYLSFMLSVLLFFGLHFSSFSRKLGNKQKDINL